LENLSSNGIDAILKPIRMIRWMYLNLTNGHGLMLKWIDVLKMNEIIDGCPTRI